MDKLHLISAIGTPLRADESLHVEGLRAHLHQQWDAGIDGVLVGGSMGLMQLLADDTYEAMLATSAEPGVKRGQVLVGIGDTSLVRTRQRLRIANRYRFDGIVAISPFFIRFNQNDLLDYYRALADEASAPLYLYHVPALTHAPLEVATVVKLAEHPNIAGIKCSGSVSVARQFADATAAHGFRVIVAHPILTDTLFRAGVQDQLDGVYAVAPRFTAGIRDAAAVGDWSLAAEYQAKLTKVLDVLMKYGIFPAFSELLNAQGVAGAYYAAPMRPLTAEARAAMLAEPIVRELLADAAKQGVAVTSNGHERREPAKI